jgi:hypothetical protein
MLNTDAQYEAQRLWRLSRELRAARQQPDNSDTMDELIDELEVLKEYADTPLIKQRCGEMLAELAPERKVV